MIAFSFLKSMSKSSYGIDRFWLHNFISVFMMQKEKDDRASFYINLVMFIFLGRTG